MDKGRDLEFEMYHKFLSCMGFEPDKFLEGIRDGNKDLYEKIENHSKKLLDVIDKADLELEYTLHEVMLYVATIVRIELHKREAKEHLPIQYRTYDYQMYVSNEMKDRQLRDFSMPSVVAFERFNVGEYKPIPEKFDIRDNKKEDTDLLIDIGKAQCEAINIRKNETEEFLDRLYETTIANSGVPRELIEGGSADSATPLRIFNEKFENDVREAAKKWEK